LEYAVDASFRRTPHDAIKKALVALKEYNNFSNLLDAYCCLREWTYEHYIVILSCAIVMDKQDALDAIDAVYKLGDTVFLRDLLFPLNIFLMKSVQVAFSLDNYFEGGPMAIPQFGLFKLRIKQFTDTGKFYLPREAFGVHHFATEQYLCRLNAKDFSNKLTREQQDNMVVNKDILHNITQTVKDLFEAKPMVDAVIPSSVAPVSAPELSATTSVAQDPTVNAVIPSSVAPVSAPELSATTSVAQDPTVNAVIPSSVAPVSAPELSATSQAKPSAVNQQGFIAHVPPFELDLLTLRAGNDGLDRCLNSTFKGKGPTVCCYPDCLAMNEKNRCSVCHSPPDNSEIVSPIYEGMFCDAHIDHNLHDESIRKSHVVDILKRMPAVKTLFTIHSARLQEQLNEFSQVCYILGVSPVNFFDVTPAKAEQLKKACCDYYKLNPEQKLAMIAQRRSRIV
jgi:hypothetical protein